MMMEFGKMFGNNALLNKNLLKSWGAFENSILSNSRKLFLISDFDHTLTTFKSMQCHDIVIPPSFHAEFRETFKIKDREESWKVSHNLIVQRSGLTRSILMEAVRKSEISLRAGTSKLLSFCRKSQIPTIVTSAGFANVIYTTMESHGVATSISDHFYVDANFLEFSNDDLGILERITPERPVHSEAKKYMPLRLGHILSLKKHFAADPSGQPLTMSQYLYGLPSSIPLSVFDDRNIIPPTGTPGSGDDGGVAAVVLGDRPADFEVLSEVPGASVFRIGFAMSSEKADELMAADCCDVVLIGLEHGVDPVLNILQKLSEIRDFQLRQASKEVSLVPYYPNSRSCSIIPLRQHNH